MQYFEQQENYLVGNFECEDFTQALEFFTDVASIAQEHNHHPDMGIYDYKFVNITSTTHSEGDQLSDKDTQLAQAVETLYAERYKK